MTDDDTDSPASEDAFALVGDEIRAEIVRTLGDARVAERSRPVLSFSELRSRTGVEVDSSRFNYHLQKLVGHFVERTDEGYRMRPEGRELYQTLRAGTFDRRASPRSVEVGLDCYYCGAAVEATFEDGVATVRCPECEYLYDTAATPPAVDDEAAALASVSLFTHHEHLAFARGVCSNCANALDAQFVPPAEVPFPGADRHEVYVYRPCDHCGDQRFLSVGEALLADTGLVSFCYERGLDVLSTPLWELEFAATDRYVTVRSTDPWEVALRVSLAGDALELVVDEDLTVVERNRP